MSQPEVVVLVDQFDNQVGTMDKMRAHSLGLLHRAFSVFILRKQDQQVEILLQQRNVDKYHCGGLWTNTCCSHPRIGEEIVAAGERRLQEEMGLQIPLQLIGNFTYRAEFANGLVEHEFDHVLVGMYDDSPINFNPTEVQDFRWIKLADLETELEHNSQAYTPWLKGALKICKDFCTLS